MGSTVKKKDLAKKSSRKKRSLRLNMPDLSTFASSLMERETDRSDKDEMRKPAVYPSCIPISEDQSKLTQTHLPPSNIFSPGLTSKISPPGQFQWYLPLLDQLSSCQHQALLQI
ncbi:hypothetical protein E1301_Tti023416 [Triplophysa tibetana]|uniref:Uncharacterized protein n=1 Tax=Triplophysa tibetana TaxID=1572043 RepID=A0A5A9NUB0_9TELE|nr:hypothetical protein E1301_Tti023416 [Triplophysa tibetana]